MKGAAAINPKDKTIMHQDAIQPMARHYGILEDNLSAELHQLKPLIDRKKTNDHDLLILLRPYKENFIDLYKRLTG